MGWRRWRQVGNTNMILCLGSQALVGETPAERVAKEQLAWGLLPGSVLRVGNWAVAVGRDETP